MQSHSSLCLFGKHCWSLCHCLGPRATTLALGLSFTDALFKTFALTGTLSSELESHVQVCLCLSGNFELLTLGAKGWRCCHQQWELLVCRHNSYLLNVSFNHFDLVSWFHSTSSMVSCTHPFSSVWCLDFGFLSLAQNSPDARYGFCTSCCRSYFSLAIENSNLNFLYLY